MKMQLVKVKFRRVIIPSSLEVIMEIYPPHAKGGESLQVCQNSPNPDYDETIEEAWKGWLFTIKQSMSFSPIPYTTFISFEEWDRFYAGVDWDKYAPCIVSEFKSIDAGRVYKEEGKYFRVNLDHSVTEIP